MLGAKDPDSLKRRGFCVAFAGLFLIGCWLSHWQYTFGHLSPCPRPSSATSDVVRIDNEPPMPTVTTPEEFEIALRSRRCVMFVDADWSFEAAAARRHVVYPLVRSLKGDRNYRDISFFRMDVTELDDSMANKLRSIPEIPWLSGYGQVLFLRSGELVDYIECAAIETRAALRQRLELALD